MLRAKILKKKKISFFFTENLHFLQLNIIAEMLYIVSEIRMHTVLMLVQTYQCFLGKGDGGIMSKQWP